MNSDIQLCNNILSKTIDINNLIDINDVKINTKLPQQERINDYIRQIKDPLCYRCGKIVVNISFSDTEETLEDRLEKYLLSL